jgi:hypothetical protein
VAGYASEHTDHMPSPAAYLVYGWSDHQGFAAAGADGLQTGIQRPGPDMCGFFTRIGGRCLAAILTHS